MKRLVNIVFVWCSVLKPVQSYAKFFNLQTFFKIFFGNSSKKVLFNIFGDKMPGFGIENDYFRAALTASLGTISSLKT